MRILILGGTNFIGPYVVRTLAGHEVTLFHRSHSSQSLDPASHIYGDRTELPRFRDVFAKLRPDVTIDMIAQNEETARLAVDCVAPFSGRMVMISSASVYRQYGVLLRIENAAVSATPADEDAPLRSRLYPYRLTQPRAPDDPAQWKDEYDKIPAEAVYLSAKQANTCILRLPMVYGPGDPDDRVGKYVRLMRSSAEVCLPEGVASWRNARGYVENIANAIALAAVDSRGGVYNLADPEDITELEWVTKIARASRWRGRVTAVENGDPRGTFPLEELPAQADFTQNLRLDTRRFRNELGYREQFPLALALAHTVNAIV